MNHVDDIPLELNCLYSQSFVYSLRVPYESKNNGPLVHSSQRLNMKMVKGFSRCTVVNGQTLHIHFGEINGIQMIRWLMNQWLSTI